MTNGVKDLDMTKEFKSVKEQFKAMYNALKKWPFMMGITILMFVLLISSEYLADNELILFFTNNRVCYKFRIHSNDFNP